jgi:hypothetical protein
VALDLRDGTELVLRVKQSPKGKGFTLAVEKQIGTRTKVVGERAATSEEELWLQIARWADQKLAQLGLEKIAK